MVITCRNYELKTSKVPGFHRISAVSGNTGVILSLIRARFIAITRQVRIISRVLTPNIQVAV